MALLPGAKAYGAYWRDRAREFSGSGSALQSVLSWIRCTANEDDTFHLETPRARGYFCFPLPSLPNARPSRVKHSDASRVRFAVRARRNSLLAGFGFLGADEAGPDVHGSDWLPFLGLRDVQVFERDRGRGVRRPLRLGLNEAEGLSLLAAAREAAERFLQSPGGPPSTGVDRLHGRLSLRSAVAVALWTRGRLRGSVISPPGPAIRTAQTAAFWACQDARFGRLTLAELSETVIQVGLIHAPRVPVSHAEIARGEAYPDKAVFLSQGAHHGMYMPEIFNFRRYRTWHSLAKSLAVEKVGLGALTDQALVEVSEVTEFIDSPDRTHAVRLDGPIACLRADEAPLDEYARESGRRACAWLAAIQREDGSLPLLLRPSTGKDEGSDVPRMIMTAHALAAFGDVFQFAPAIDTARRVLDWGHRARPAWGSGKHALLITCHLGKAALCLGDEAGLDSAVKDVLQNSERVPDDPLNLAHAASFLNEAATKYPRALARAESLREQAHARFLQSRRTNASMSLAEWAELLAAFPDGSSRASEIVAFLCKPQLPSGAFPNTTTSSFVYTRGSGKVFEVLAQRADCPATVIERCLRWLLSMQYRADSMFFVPTEHRSRVAGGFRHDSYNPDAWIDSAGHVLLGLSRLASR
jgi:AMMECR1 domain-containing protein